MSEKSETQKLVPGREVKLSSGRVVQVKELSFGEAKRAHEAPGGVEFLREWEREPDRTPYALMRVTSRHQEWWSDFLSRAAGVAATEVDEMPTRDGFQLVLAVLGENPLFFDLAAATMPAPATAGSSTPSPSSSATGTETPPA